MQNGEVRLVRPIIVHNMTETENSIIETIQNA